MKKINLKLCFVLLLCYTSTVFASVKNIDDSSNNSIEAKFKYSSFTNDSSHMRIYKLKNGLTVYLAKNNDQPRIQTYIAVRAGSNNDPSDNTGLAHYLEHMLFKGTSKLATTNIVEEKKYLAKIAELYEQHKAQKNAEKRKAIYREIDNLSNQAAKYAVANEYDKITALIGATNTNAHTWHNETVYQNDIPANELPRWLALEKERMSELVLRLFHTELEAVYEEYNQSQDNNERQLLTKVQQQLFPSSNYGLQTTIGLPEHLKSPSMFAIHKYFKKYYVPSNMAVILVGDLKFDETIALIDKTLGQLPAAQAPAEYVAKEADFTEPKIDQLINPEAENITLAYRLSTGSKTVKSYPAILIQQLLSGPAGLISLNINQQQKALTVSSELMQLKDYDIHIFVGIPKRGQSLEQVKQLIENELNKIKAGDFDDWMLTAVLNNYKKLYLQQSQQRDFIATLAYQNFINRSPWSQQVDFYNQLSKITKQDIVDYANKQYQNNLLILYKKQGKNKNIVHVDNPKIMPLTLNRQQKSSFYKQLEQMPVAAIKPVFVNFNTAIKQQPLNKFSILYSIDNPNNELASLSYITEIGKDNQRELALAFAYADYLGTNKYSPSQLKQQLFKAGINISWKVNNKRSYISIEGLNENVLTGIKFVENIIKNLQPDQQIYNNLVADILKGRQDNKENNTAIFSGLTSYAKFKDNSRFKDVFSEQQLLDIKPQHLVNLIHDYFDYPHNIFYYGHDLSAIKAKLLAIHDFGKNKAIPIAKQYTGVQSNNNVYFYSYPQAQASLNIINKGKQFSLQDIASAALYNGYFGLGLSSVVFQDIREAKSLAYSAYSLYSLANYKNETNYLLASFSTQTNKLAKANQSMMILLNSDLPKAQTQFNNAKSAALKDLASKRYNRTNIFYYWLSLKDLGFDCDISSDVYAQISNMSFNDLNTFFKQNIQGEKFNFALIGDKKLIDWQSVAKLGTVHELTSKQIFGY